MSDFSFIPPTSVVTIPGTHASAAFTSKTSEVFKEEHNIAPIIINDKMKYIPWGGDNQMPYNIIDLIESDETMSTCQMYQNVIPASKERIERLLLSLEKQRDDALAVILTMLPDAHHWTASEKFNYFAATMFPTLDIVHQLGVADHIWLRYQDTRAKLLPIEHRLETEFFSPELMDMLRTANALNKWDMTLDTAQYKRMYQRISAIEFSILRIGEYPIPSIIDIVNSIRLAKGNVFAEWKQSDTAKLFEDHGYKNKKQAGGYFF